MYHFFHCLRFLLLPYALFFGIAALYFHPLLSAKLIFVERDLSAFFIPPRLLWVNLVRSGTAPFWNPYNYSGIPLLATLQPGVLYPPHLLYLFLPFNVAWNWLIILHFFFAGITMYTFLRYLKAGKEAAFLGGATFMLSGYLLSVHNLLPHLFAVSWFPLILMYFLKYCDRGGIKSVVYTAIFLTIQFLSGAPEISVMTVLAVIVLLFFADSFNQEPTGFLHRAKGLALVLVLFALMSCVQFLPFYELSYHSIRKGGLTYREATTWSFGWRDFLLFFLPDAFGYFQNETKYWANQSWLKTLYLGLTPFVLSMIFFFSKDKKRVFFLLLMVLSFIFALGHNTPVYELLYRFPPFNSVRYPVKFLFLFFSVLAIATGLGVERLKSLLPEDRTNIGRIITVFFYVGFLFAIGWGYMNLFEGNVREFLDHAGIKPSGYNEIALNMHNMNRFLLFSFLFCLSLLAYLRVKRKRIMILVLIGLATADLFLANFGYYGTTPWKFYMEPHSFAEKISAHGNMGRYLMTPKTMGEFNHFPGNRMVLNPSYAAIFPIYAIQGSEVLRSSHYDTFLSILENTPSLDEAKRFFDIAGVQYIIAAYRIEDRDFEVVDQTQVKDTDVYLHEYLPDTIRFGLFSRIVKVNDENEAIAKLRDSGVDLSKELILFRNENPVNPKPGVTGRTTLISYGPNKVCLDYQVADDAFLYLSDTYYPGWRAYVDGKETKIYRANLAFRAVQVPAGNHRVEFRYVPLSFYAGLGLTVLGIVLALFLVLRERRKERSGE